MARYILERGWDQQPWLSARNLPHILHVITDSTIAAREPKQMLGKLLLVNMGELELETSSMMTTRLEINESQ